MNDLDYKIIKLLVLPGGTLLTMYVLLTVIKMMIRGWFWREYEVKWNKSISSSDFRVVIPLICSLLVVREQQFLNHVPN